MKNIVYLICVTILFVSCPGPEETETETEPPYKAEIAWIAREGESELFSNDHISFTVDDDFVYFYERPAGETVVNIYYLTKLNAETGELIWRSNIIFSDIIFCQMVITDAYVYVFLEPNGIICFDQKNGKNTASVMVVTEDDDDMRIPFSGVTLDGEHLYFGLWNFTSEYLVRLDLNKIHHENPDTWQKIVPEIIWRPETQFTPWAKPVIYKNAVYSSTITEGSSSPIELVGYDIDTKEKVFHKVFGGFNDGDVPFPETGGLREPIIIHEDILYYLSGSVSAWDLKTGETLYRHIFPWNYPNPLNYTPAGNIKQPLYYKGKIYYTSGTDYNPTHGYRNIHCIDAATGELVWNDVAKNSVSLEANPIIAHDQLFITQYVGLRVYNPKDGKLIGVDKSFYGSDLGLNILYKDDYIICMRWVPGTGDMQPVAVYVGK